MSGIRIPCNLTAIVTRHNFVSNAPDYQVEFTLLGTPFRVAVPEQFVARVENLLSEDVPEPQDAFVANDVVDSPEGYHVGVVDDKNPEDYTDEEISRL